MTGAMWGGGGSYQQWADLLERWSRGEDVDPSALPPLVPADFPADTWTRLAARLTTALDARLRAWADGLSAALSAADDEFAAGRALTQARAGLRTVRSLAAHPGLPEEARTGLTDLVDTTTRRVQQQIDDDLARQAAHGVPPSLVEARRRTVRDNPLTAVTAESPAAPAPADGADRAGGGWSYDPSVRSRRRVGGG